MLEKEEHITNVSAVLEILGEKQMRAGIDLCASDKPNRAEPGFNIDPIDNDDLQAFNVVLRRHLAPDALEAIDRKLR